MWTNENRARYDRSKLRYPSDLADTEWAIIAPLIPPAKRGGNKRTVVEREIVNGLMYILSTGCQWASLPKDLPPRSTVNDYFCRWNSDGTLDRIHHALYVKCRELAEAYHPSDFHVAQSGGGAMRRCRQRRRRRKPRVNSDIRLRATFRRCAPAVFFRQASGSRPHPTCRSTPPRGGPATAPAGAGPADRCA